MADPQASPNIPHQRETVLAFPSPRWRWHGWMRLVTGGKAHAVYRTPDGYGGWRLIPGCDLAKLGHRYVLDPDALRCRACVGGNHRDNPTGGDAA